MVSCAMIALCLAALAILKNLTAARPWQPQKLARNTNPIARPRRRAQEKNRMKTTHTIEIDTPSGIVPFTSKPKASRSRRAQEEAAALRLVLQRDGYTPPPSLDAEELTARYPGYRLRARVTDARPDEAPAEEESPPADELTARQARPPEPPPEPEEITIPTEDEREPRPYSWHTVMIELRAEDSLSPNAIRELIDEAAEEAIAHLNAQIIGSYLLPDADEPPF